MEIVVESYELDFIIETESKNEIKYYKTDKSLTVPKNVLQKTKDILRKLINKIIGYLNAVSSKIIYKFTSMKEIEAKAISVKDSDRPESLELKNFIISDAIEVLFDEIKSLSNGVIYISDSTDEEGKKFDDDIIITESQILNAVYYKMVKEVNKTCKALNIPYEGGDVKVESDGNFSSKINPRTADKKFLKNMCATDCSYKGYSSAFIDHISNSVKKASNYDKDIKQINHKLRGVLKDIEEEKTKNEVIMNVEVVCNATLKLVAILQKGLMLMIKSSKDVLTQYYGESNDKNNKKPMKLLPAPSTNESYVNIAMLEVAELHNSLMYDMIENSLSLNESASDKIIKAGRKILDAIVLIINKIRAFIRKIIKTLLSPVSKTYDIEIPDFQGMEDAMQGKSVTYYDVADYIILLSYISANSINARSCLDIEFDIINFHAKTVNKKFNQYEFVTGIFKSALPDKSIDDFDPYQLAYSLTSAIEVHTKSRMLDAVTLDKILNSKYFEKTIEQYLSKLDKNMASLKNEIEKIKKEHENVPLYDIKYGNLLNYISAVYMYLGYSKTAIMLINKNIKMAKDICDEYKKHKD